MIIIIIVISFSTDMIHRLRDLIGAAQRPLHFRPSLPDSDSDSNTATHNRRFGFGFGFGFVAALLLLSCCLVRPVCSLTPGPEAVDGPVSENQNQNDNDNETLVVIPHPPYWEDKNSFLDDFFDESLALDMACNSTNYSQTALALALRARSGNPLNTNMPDGGGAFTAVDYGKLVMCHNGSDDGTEVDSSEALGLGRGLRVPVGEAVGIGLLLGSIVFATIFGNCLVVLSVFTYRPLKNVPNFLIASLAVSDFAVAFLVMPFNIYDTLYQPWMLGRVVCEIFTTSDVFFCTSSILNLCAIAVDRYYAIHDPLNYAQKRTAKRMIITIIAVYAASGLISVPPLLGWRGERADEHCSLSDNMAYVIISALGSFYIPCFVMCFVYVNIFLVARRRLRQRAKHSATKSSSSPSKKRDRESSCSSARNSIWSMRKGHRFLAFSKSNSHNNNSERNSSFRCAEGDDRANKVPSECPIHHPHHHQHQLNVGNREGKYSCTCTCVHHDAAVAITVSASLDRKVSVDSASTPDETTHPSTVTTATGAVTAGAFESLTCSDHNHNHNQNGKNKAKEQSAAGPSFIKSFAAERQKISLSRERKAARTLAILGGTFLVSWLPFFTWYLLGPFCESCKNLDRNWANFLVWLGYANSATNPVLYTIFNADFRRAFQKLLHLPGNDNRKQLRNARKR